ncbi:MAG: nucleoside/nucleotide kinase family protein [Pseudonocardiaceae bacterium]
MRSTAEVFDQLVGRARLLVGDGNRVLLGITGPPGAGKTTLAEQLVEALAPVPPPGLVPYHWVAQVPMDGFHLADGELARLHRRDRRGAPDTFDPAGYAALLRRLRHDSDEVVYAPGFERILEQPLAGAIPVPPSARLIITEGNYLLLPDHGWNRVRPELDEVWYVDLDPAERMRRLIARHVRFGKDRTEAVAWVAGIDEPNAVLVNQTRHRADLIVPSIGGPRDSRAVTVGAVGGGLDHCGAGRGSVPTEATTGSP